MSDVNFDSNERISAEVFAKGSVRYFIYFLLAAIPQWIIMSLYMGKDQLVYTLACFFLSFILLICIHMSEILKHRPPFNYLATACCYELMTLGVGSFVMDTNLSLTLLSVLSSLIICVVVIVIGYSITNHFNYPNPYKFGALSEVGFVMVILIAAISTIYYADFAVLIAINILIVSVVILILGHIFMSMENIDYLVEGDILMLGFVFYMNYVILLIAVYIDIKHIQEHVDVHLLKIRTTPNGE